MQRISWHEATELNATEFFNTFVYAVEKQRHREALEKKAYEQARSRTRR